MSSTKVRTGFLIIVGGMFAVVAAPVPANLITNANFEVAEPTYIFGFPGLPTTYGDWGGDPSQIVTAERGIVPLAGQRMMRFDAAGNTADPLLNSGEVWQIVDVSSHATQIASGNARALVSAWFNRVSGDAQTDTSFGVTMSAFTGTVSNFWNDVVGGAYTAAGFGVTTDSDVATWEEAAGQWPIPIGTTYMAVRVGAYENIFNDGVAPEFDGHYC